VPGDLRDPEQSTGWYYDPKFDATPNMFDPGSDDMDAYLQSIAEEATGQRMNGATLDSLKKNLVDKGFFCRNTGDESFRNQVKKLLMARRMVARWLT